jgi:hypothetical protein
MHGFIKKKCLNSPNCKEISNHEGFIQGSSSTILWADSKESDYSWDHQCRLNVMGYKLDGQVHGLPKFYSGYSHLEWTACIMPLEAYWMRVKKAQASRCNMPREAFATKWMSWARRYNRPDGAVNVWWSMCVIWAGECTRPDICHQCKKEVAWAMHSQIHSPTCSQ